MKKLLSKNIEWDVSKKGNKTGGFRVVDGNRKCTIAKILISRRSDNLNLLS